MPLLQSKMAKPGVEAMTTTLTATAATTTTKAAVDD